MVWMTRCHLILLVLVINMGIRVRALYVKMLLE